MLIVGIDPGAAGFISAVSGCKVEFRPIPHFKMLIGKTHRSIVDIKAALKLFAMLKNSAAATEAFAIIERQQAMVGKGGDGQRRDGASGAFIMGGNYRTLLNALDLAELPYDVVSPVVWKKHFELLKRPTETQPQAKQRAADYAAKLYPSVADAIRKDRQHGLAESLLIGRYGAIKHGYMT